MSDVREIAEMTADLAVVAGECAEEECERDRGDMGPLLIVFSECLTEVARALAARDVDALARALHQTGAPPCALDPDEDDDAPEGY